VIARLERFGLTPLGTFGEFIVGPHRWYSVERQWSNNAPFVSCIPPGLYDLVPHDSPRWGETVAVVGPGVSVNKDGAHRYGILIHPANTANELQGCIALGKSLGYVSGSWAVLDSRNSVAAALKVLRGGAQLEIRNP